MVPLEVDPFPKGLTPHILKETLDGALQEEVVGWEATAQEQAEFEKQFVMARAGDHLMTPFQCEDCHFKNIFGCLPQTLESPKDKWVIACIVRANLDGFWARRPSTVLGNLQEMSRMMKQAHQMRIDFPMQLFPQGPFPLQDSLGMVPAIMSLQRLLDRGRNSRTIQWDTMRGMRSAYSNVVHTTLSGTGAAIFSDGRKTTQTTNSSNNGLWFQQFMERSHERMGDVRISDLALTIDVLLSLDLLMEKSWAEAVAARDLPMKFEIATTCCMVNCGYSAGLRGEELGHIWLRDSILLTTQGLQHVRVRHVVLAFEGRFKGQTSCKKHKIPLAIKSASGISNWKWLQRLIEVYEAYGVTFGPLFGSQPHSDEPVRIRQLDVWFHRYLFHLQSTQPSVIPASTDVLSVYSVRRSLRHGSTTQARNKKVPKDVVDLNNRWRSEDAAGNCEVCGSMMLETYTDVLVAIEVLLQYSESL